MQANIEKISRHESYSQNFKKIEIKPNQKYSIESKLTAYSGHFTSGYVLAVVLDKDDNRLKRFARYITDFSGNPKNYTITFSSPPESKSLILGLRINLRNLTKSDFEFSIPDDKSFTITEVSNSVEDSFDTLTGPTELETERTLDENEEKKLEENLVWVLGSTRSGSTWVATQLLNHQDAISWNEPNITRLFKIVRDQHTTGGNRFNYFFSPQHKNSWVPLVRKLILKRTFSQVRTLSKKIIVKEPESAAADLLMETIPNSKLIFLVRDGRDVVDSWIDAHNKDSWNINRKPLRTEEARSKKIKEYSNYWKDLTKDVLIAYQNHNPKLRLLIKYEDLRKDTLSKLKQIYEFLNIDASEEEIKKIVDRYSFEKIPSSQKGKGKFYRSASPGSWKDNLSEQEKDLMNSILEEPLKKMEYQV